MREDEGLLDDFLGVLVASDVFEADFQFVGEDAF